MFGYSYHLIVTANHHSFQKPSTLKIASAGVQRHLALRPDRAPARPDDRAASPDGLAHRRRPQVQPGPERCKSVALRLPGAASGGLQGSASCGPQELLLKSLCASFVSFVRFVVWSVVDGYNYQLIVIASRKHCFPNPAPGELPLPEAGSPGPQARPGLLCARSRALAWQPGPPGGRRQ